MNPSLERHIDQQNAKPTVALRAEGVLQPFIKEGQKVKNRAQANKSHLLSRANDWKLLVDYDGNPVVFPPTILTTRLRPDIIIWSESKRIVIWAELTCPAEENMSQARARKVRRYKKLAEDVRAEGWTLHDFTIEVGARGCVGHSVRHFLRRIGLSHYQSKLIVNEVALVAARTSFHIYLASRNTVWTKHALLNGRPKGQESH